MPFSKDVVKRRIWYGAASIVVDGEWHASSSNGCLSLSTCKASMSALTADDILTPFGAEDAEEALSNYAKLMNGEEADFDPDHYTLTAVREIARQLGEQLTEEQAAEVKKRRKGKLRDDYEAMTLWSNIEGLFLPETSESDDFEPDYFAPDLAARDVLTLHGTNNAEQAMADYAKLMKGKPVDFDPDYYTLTAVREIANQIGGSLTEDQEKAVKKKRKGEQRDEYETQLLWSNIKDSLALVMPAKGKERVYERDELVDAGYGELLEKFQIMDRERATRPPTHYSTDPSNAYFDVPEPHLRMIVGNILYGGDARQVSDADIQLASGM